MKVKVVLELPIQTSSFKKSEELGQAHKNNRETARSGSDAHDGDDIDMDGLLWSRAPRPVSITLSNNNEFTNR